MAVGLIDLAREGPVAVVTLRRPPVNAFSTTMWERMIEIVDEIDSDSTVAVAVVTGEGSKVFSAGADVKELREMTADQREQRAHVVQSGLSRVYSAAIPLIAAINGPAIGGGLNLATLCDVRIAAESAHFSLPEIAHGATAGGGAFLRRIGVPTGVVRRMIFAAERIDAPAAVAAHLVDEVVPSDELMGRALELAAGMAEHGRPSLVRMKRAAIAADSAIDWRDAYRLAAAAAQGHGEHG